MSTSNAALPTGIAKGSLIYIWIGTVVYGANCVMYGLSIFILLRGHKTAPLRGVLVSTSTILFLLCTAYAGASLQQLLEAFVYVPANVPDYSTKYWLDNTTVLAVLKSYVYITLILVYYFVFIWRLYVVFCCNWRVVLLPIIMALGCLGILYTTATLYVHENVATYTSVASNLIKAAWVLDTTLNLVVTLAIAGRLWWMGRKTAASIPTRTNQYAFSVYVIIESGAIVLVTNIAIIVLFVSSNIPASLSIVDVASQFAALTQFLIVVQVGITARHRIPPISSGRGDSTMVTSQDRMVFRTGPREEDGLQEDVPA